MLELITLSVCHVSYSEYTITMYDTKSRELRWNATYSDYASTLPDDDTIYSTSCLFLPHFLILHLR